MTPRGDPVVDGRCVDRFGDDRRERPQVLDVGKECGARPPGVGLIADGAIDAEIIAPGVPTPTVPDAARALGVMDRQIVKSLLFAAKDVEHNHAQVLQEVLQELAG